MRLETKKDCCFNGPEFKLKHVMRDIEDHFSGTKSGVCENSLEMCEIRNDKATVLLTGMYKLFCFFKIFTKSGEI